MGPAAAAAAAAGKAPHLQLGPPIFLRLCRNPRELRAAPPPPAPPLLQVVSILLAQRGRGLQRQLQHALQGPRRPQVLACRSEPPPRAAAARARLGLGLAAAARHLRLLPRIMTAPAGRRRLMLRLLLRAGGLLQAPRPLLRVRTSG